jgi:glycerol-3-phosphate O-acyltransferase
MSGGRPIVFVMERFQLLDLFVLNNVLRRFGMPAVKREARSNGFLEVAFLALRSNVLRFYGLERRDPFSDYLEDLLSHDTRLHENGVCLLPVSVFWSRGAERSERNFIFRGLFPDDGSANFFQKILLFASHGGIVDIHFGNPHIVTRNSLPELLATPGLSPIDRARRYRRVLMAELNRERTAAMGPALYEFSTVANWILADPETQKMINEGPNSKRNQKKAHHYLREMAAAYNYTTVRALEAALDFVWTRIFKGIRVRNFGAVREVARTGHILWLPCHKSHLDYLLLSYVVRKQGLVGPHIAAGVNLSFWPAGPILRRGGAFFMRRSFSGNKLYTKVFAGYVDFLMHNGYPIEYFHEGGRSRIGKLLTPRYGFTSFCVRSILRRKAAATYVVPVYFGYDKVMEDDTYAREVSGAKKHKESLWQLLASIRFLFSNYGRVDVSFGTPIHFGDFWKEYLAHHEAMGQVLLPARDGATRGSLERLEEDIDVRHPLVQSCIESLGLRVNEGINAAAVASGTSLMAVAMLAAREDSVDADRLGNRFETAAWIVDTVSRELGWKLSNAFSAVEGSFSLAESPSVLLPESRGGDEPVSSSPMPSQEALSAFHEALDSCLRWGFLTKSDNEPDAAVMATEGAATPGASHLFRYRRSEEKSLNLYWYRGTVFHIFAIPGVVGKIIQQHRDSGASSISRAALVSGFEAVRSVWKLEVFWPRATTSEQLVAAGLLILRGLGTVGECEGDQINIVQGESAGGHLDFVSGLVRTEKELYGLQLAAAIKLTEAKGSFRREELIHHAHALHRGAFLRSIVTSPASLTLVYGGRSFDALLNVGVFVLKPGNVLRLSFGALQPLTEFFDVADLNKVQV